MKKKDRHSDQNRPPSRPEEIDEAGLLAHLSAASHPQSIREIAAALKLRHWGRRALPKLLSRLKRSGDVDESHGRFRLTGQRPDRKSAPAHPQSSASAPAGRE